MHDVEMGLDKIDKCGICGKLAFQGDSITISVDEYQALTRYAEIGRERKTIGDYRAVSRSAIARNPRLADFILEHSITMTTSEVFQKAKEKFGEKVPSRSAVYRFVEMMKSQRRT